MKQNLYCKSLVLGVCFSALSGNAEAICPEVNYDTLSHIQHEGEIVDLDANGVPYTWRVVGVDQLPGTINQVASNKIFSIENTEIREEGAPKQACVYKYHTVSSKAASALGEKRWKFTLIRIIPAGVVENLATIGSNDTSSFSEIQSNFNSKMDEVKDKGGDTGHIQQAYDGVIDFLTNGGLVNVNN